jgi:hypothetical protein
MTEDKKEWIPPELIVLVRSKQEEAVLALCKNLGFNTPQGSWTDCWTSPGTLCESIASS